MSPVPEQLLISVHPFETRLAIVADGLLVELHATAAGEESAVGSVALGRVLRVLPGMQSAFVECGLERPGFLHVSDTQRHRSDADGGLLPPPDIRSVLHEGQVMPVQITKDPLASKGARLTTNLALPARFLVLTPDSDHIGVSQRITDEDERERLRTLVARCAAASGMDARHGFIVRTAAAHVSEAEVQADMQLLAATWREVSKRRVEGGVGDVLYRDLPTHLRVVRDLLGEHTRCIKIDEPLAHARLREFIATAVPDYQGPIELCRPREGLFAAEGLEEQVRQALLPEVRLPSGGHLVIEQTEAMVTVDVNTGGYVGSSTLEDTVYQTNLEAARALPRELRLRNLGGLIVVDFIDMEALEHRDAVVAALREGCETDPGRVRTSQMSEFGLVEMSRKRTRESLSRQFSDACCHCDGSGRLPRAEACAFDVLRALERLHATSPVLASTTAIEVHAHERIVDHLEGDGQPHVAAFCERSGRRVTLIRSAGMRAGEYELLPVHA